MLNEFTKRIHGLSRRQRAVGVTLGVLIGVAVYGFTQLNGPSRGHSDVSSQSRRGGTRYTRTPAEWASLSIQPVIEKPFRAAHVTEGKIAIDHDRSTPVFSPYAGRVTTLLVRPATPSPRDSRCSPSKRPTPCRRRTITSRR